MKSFLNSRPPNQTLWIALSAAFILLGGGLLLVFLLQKPPGKSGPEASSAEEVYTSAALTLNAQLTSPAATPALPDQPSPTLLPTDTVLPSPSASLSPLPTQAASSIANGSCKNSIYVSDVTIPDGTLISPGTSYVKTWMFQNTGTCSWDANYQLIFISGDQMGGKAALLGQSVAPYGQVPVSVTLTAPAADGTYTGYWRLADDQGAGFGGVVFVKIVVSSGTATFTPTGSQAPAATTAAPAASSTPSATPSLTHAPSATLTATPAPGTPSPSPTPTSGG